MTVKQKQTVDLKYNAAEKCRLRSPHGEHNKHIAAICPLCYEAALEQKQKQRDVEIDRAWAAYERRNARRAA